MNGTREHPNRTRGGAFHTPSLARPVVLFVWGLTREDAAKAEAHAHQQAEWRRWRVVRVVGPVIGGPASTADRGGYGTAHPITSNTDYGQVWEFYEPRPEDLPAD
ncbi:hypothetical protein [Carbonactinospora thermoautotrophica]|uniref:hypothetical protein n=1 Tax=Carbonactinospora thermoautotrophica TaxID=1469144 RepID=UPI000A9645CF|nr:hypothetical protein [Carbonactinospora thermoautotrophica]